MRNDKLGYSTYSILKNRVSRLGCDVSDMEKRLVNFLKKTDNFSESVYSDYIRLLANNRDITVNDFFDKNYINRHDILAQERRIRLRLL